MGVRIGSMTGVYSCPFELHANHIGAKLVREDPEILPAGGIVSKSVVWLQWDYFDVSNVGEDFDQRVQPGVREPVVKVKIASDGD